MSREVLVKRIEVEQDRFKVGVSLVVLVTSGLVGLVLKRELTPAEYALMVGGALFDAIGVMYVVKTYIKVNRLLLDLEERYG